MSFTDEVLLATLLDPSTKDLVLLDQAETPELLVKEDCDTSFEQESVLVSNSPKMTMPVDHDTTATVTSCNGVSGIAADSETRLISSANDDDDVLQKLSS